MAFGGFSPRYTAITAKAPAAQSAMTDHTTILKKRFVAFLFARYSARITQKCWHFCFRGELFPGLRGSIQHQHPIAFAIAVRSRRRELARSSVSQLPPGHRCVGSVCWIEPL